jgi:energy-converting hydrogenase A subunit R
LNKISRKSFITDCEGPLTLNDNAFEIAEKFIPEGGEFFKILSKYDDCLVEANYPNYHAGDTLKLISPFFKAYDVTNQDLIDYSKKNIDLVYGADETLKYANEKVYSYIVSTSYGQYIQALCESVRFPYENTVHSHLDLDEINITNEEKSQLKDFHDEILKLDLENIDQFHKLDEIFFDKIPKMQINQLMEKVDTVGGEGKKQAVKRILKREDLPASNLMYMGDSITDVEPLQYAKENGGLAIAFNGNPYAIEAAEIAIISDNTIVTSLLVDLHARYDNDYVREFVQRYSEKGHAEAFFIMLNDEELVVKFDEEYQRKNLPLIEKITDENKEYLIEKSMEMRQTIRGTDIGGLG